MQVARSRFVLKGDRPVETVASEIPGFAASKADGQRWVAWLPSNEHGALPSSPLLTESSEDRGPVQLAPWEVPALVLTTEQAVAILLAGIDRTTWGPGVIVGKSLAYWETVLRFAGADFWDGAGEQPTEDAFGVVEVPRDSAALARRLGGFRFWRGESPFLDSLSVIYEAASPRGLDGFLEPVNRVDRSKKG